MIQNQPKHLRILAVAPSTRGFGFAVLEGQETLVDWGVKAVTGDKNPRCIVKLKDIIDQYTPDVMALQDNSRKDSRRSARIRILHRRMIALASSEKLNVQLFSRAEVRQTFFIGAEGTKHALAEILAKRFPAELGFRLPPKRRPWMSEDYRMAIFDAVALALAGRTANQ